jgi:AraC-like DNA-binding protein
MERTAFSRFFRQRIGITFSEFLRAYRIELAIKRMLTSNASLKEISHSVGFSSFATFERQFKREAGVCPSAFRSRELGRIGVVAKSGNSLDGEDGVSPPTSNIF